MVRWVPTSRDELEAAEHQVLLQLGPGACTQRTVSTPLCDTLAHDIEHPRRPNRTARPSASRLWLWLSSVGRQLEGVGGSLQRPRHRHAGLRAERPA